MEQTQTAPNTAVEAPLPLPDIELTVVATTAKRDNPFLVSFDEPFDAESPKCTLTFTSTLDGTAVLTHRLQVGQPARSGP